MNDARIQQFDGESDDEFNKRQRFIEEIKAKLDRIGNMPIVSPVMKFPLAPPNMEFVNQRLEELIQDAIDEEILGPYRALLNNQSDGEAGE